MLHVYDSTPPYKIDRQEFTDALTRLKRTDRDAWLCLTYPLDDACDYLICSRRSYYRYRARGLETMVNSLVSVVQ